MITPVIRFTEKTIIMDGERILYPCYFDTKLKRSEGRRVPLSAGIEKSDIKEIYRAAKKLGLAARTEEGRHPAHWTGKGGRVIVGWEGSKEDLIRKITGVLTGSR